MGAVPGRAEVRAELGTLLIPPYEVVFALFRFLLIIARPGLLSRLKKRALQRASMLSSVLRTFKSAGKRVFRRSTGERSIRAAYLRHYGRSPNIQCPLTFSEKVLSRMIALERASDRSLTPLVDKLLVRNYVRERVGSEHLIDLLWHGTDPRAIPFDSLPESYVIKTNHGSGGHVFVRGQPDRARVVDRFRAALRDNYYWRSREFQYFHIVPHVLVEELIDDGVAFGPLDYRCWCFHGQVRLIQVDNHAHSQQDFYDQEWNPQELRHRSEGTEATSTAKPANLSELIEVAQALARGFDFVRVDLYNARQHVYFGELTFTPRAGLFTFHPEAWDAKLGSWW